MPMPAFAFVVTLGIRVCARNYVRAAGWIPFGKVAVGWMEIGWISVGWVAVNVQAAG